ncbi:MAG: DUF190 domain-containing protein [Planctomycetota bacterium]|jgi:PII-like signaling protein
MTTREPGRLLRVYVGESDQWNGRPLYEAIVLKARELDLAGATVLRGPMGFGSHHEVHTAKILRLAEDLPVVVEIVDTPEKIEDSLPHLQAMLSEGMATLEDVTILHPGKSGAPAGD